MHLNSSISSRFLEGSGIPFTIKCSSSRIDMIIWLVFFCWRYSFFFFFNFGTANFSEQRSEHTVHEFNIWACIGPELKCTRILVPSSRAPITPTHLEYVLDNLSSMQWSVAEMCFGREVFEIFFSRHWVSEARLFVFTSVPLITYAKTLPRIRHGLFQLSNFSAFLDLS